MTDPQVWTLIGVFSAIMFAALGVSTRYTVSTLRAEIQTVDVKHDAQHRLVRADLGALEHRMDERFAAADQRIDERFEAMNRSIDERFTAINRSIDQRFTATDRRIDERFEAMNRRMDERFEAMNRRMDERFSATDRRIDERFEATDEKSTSIRDVLGIRLDAIDHRLTAVEDDMKIIKAHLLRHPAA